ncbi:unnamed protein product [Leuciscus chuanchicus]
MFGSIKATVIVTKAALSLTHSQPLELIMTLSKKLKANKRLVLTQCKILQSLSRLDLMVCISPDPLDVSDITTRQKTTDLEGLPLFQHENSTSLPRMRLDTDPLDHGTKDVEIGILTVAEDAAVTSLPTLTN